MQSSSASITDALSAEEVCPLCLDRYTAADECTCVVCRAPSCPGCAETVDADGAMRCFACRPMQLDAQPGALAARQTLSLPRPIALSACTPELTARVHGEPPPLPFPLTTSPRGVRSFKPRPPGSVFVGLPSVPAQLSETLRAGNTTTAPRSQVRVQQARAQLSALQRNVQRGLAQWSQHGQAQWRVWQQRLPSLVRSLEAWFRSGLARVGAVRGERLRSSIAQLHASVSAHWQHTRLSASGRERLLRLQQAALAQLPRARLTLARLTQVKQLGRASLAQLKRLSQSRLGKPLSRVSERLSRARSLSEGRLSAPQSDHSRPISL